MLPVTTLSIRKYKNKEYCKVGYNVSYTRTHKLYNEALHIASRKHNNSESELKTSDLSNRKLVMQTFNNRMQICIFIRFSVQ